MAPALGLAARRHLRLAVDPVLWLHHLAREHLRRARLGAAEAGGLIALFTGIGLVPTLAVPCSPIGSARAGPSSRSPRCSPSPGTLIIALTPAEPAGSLLTFGRGVLLGLGIGAYFPLALTLPVDVAGDAADAASISALMLLIGYLLAAISPVVLGFARDTSATSASCVDPRRHRRRACCPSRSRSTHGAWRRPAADAKRARPGT